MPVKFVDHHMTGFMPILKATAPDADFDGYLLGGCTVDDGVVFNHFFEALTAMNDLIEVNREAFRKVKVAMVWECEGMV